VQVTGAVPVFVNETASDVLAVLPPVVVMWTVGAVPTVKLTLALFGP
jgi:hypothetical protein